MFLFYGTLLVFYTNTLFGLLFTNMLLTVTLLEFPSRVITRERKDYALEDHLVQLINGEELMGINDQALDVASFQIERMQD